MTPIGRIEKVDLREVWPHEAHDFTRWLGDNLDVLSEELGIELTDAETESAAGDFSCDVVARDDGERLIVIENQLELSNHDHLGKLLTYFAMMNAYAGIWIVREARPEHVSAVSWLNENSSADFYIVQVEAIRIGESLPAPLLTRIVGPSAETRKVRSQKQELSESKRLLKDFWTQLLERALQSGSALHANVSPKPQNWVSASAGRAGLGLNYVTAKDSSRIELYIDRGHGAAEINQQVFDSLFAEREAIEAEFGDTLVWERLEDARACRISYRVASGGYRSDDGEWPEIQEAMIAAMLRFEHALRPRIDALAI